MKITALIENTSDNPNLACEHGLSLYLETEQKKILFDMGQSKKFYENAEKLNIDISKADSAIISHGHYDHGGGLSHFLEINAHAPVYIHCQAFGSFYNADNKFIGLDKKTAENPRIIFTGDKKELGENLCLETKNTAEQLFPMPKQNLKLLTESGFQADVFRHEQYLLIRENNKKILITGCAHKGILNILEWFRPDYAVGGFHFKQYDLNNCGCKSNLKAIAEKMAEFPTVFYTGHCTGKEQFEFLHAVLGNQISYLSTGQQINI